MKFRQKIALHLLLYFTLSSAAFAQEVEIPDPNLRVAVAETLGVRLGLPILEEDMKRLERLRLEHGNVHDLTGLELATNLIEFAINTAPPVDLTPIFDLLQLQNLTIWQSAGPEDIAPLANITSLTSLEIGACGIIDISPLANLTNLTHLNLRINRIVDITPLAHLSNLAELRLSSNRIIDIAPLANLTNLTALWLYDNRIVDVQPLAGLTQLQVLEIELNLIGDHSPLDSLRLSHFTYDQVCDMPPLPLTPRVDHRTYPSIFARWSGFDWPPITNRPDLSDAENLARHDLRFSGNVFGLDFREVSDGFKMAGLLDRAVQKRDELHALNPNKIHLVDVGIRAAPLEWFPPDSPYWILDESGTVYLESEDVGHGLLDFTNPIVQDRIVAQAVAVAECGLYDGIFFDYWSEEWRVLGGFRTMEEEQSARDTILRRIGAETRPNFLIMGNVNIQMLPRTAPYVNGGFMETVLPFTRNSDQQETILKEIENTLLWLDTHLREPRINGLEGWAIPTEPPDSPNNLRWMRAITALSLTHSNGYVVYTIPDNWGHYWYDFWDADLGRPVGEKGQLYQETDGLYIREFTNGWAVYNHSGEEQILTFPEEAQGVASRLSGTEHTLPNLDGEMYLRVKPPNPADVNEDGVVNIFDLTLVAQAFGKDGLQGDVNGDGVVNVFDLVFVANQF